MPPVLLARMRRPKTTSKLPPRHPRKTLRLKSAETHVNGSRRAAHPEISCGGYRVLAEKHRLHSDRFGLFRRGGIAGRALVCLSCASARTATSRKWCRCVRRAIRCWMMNACGPSGNGAADRRLCVRLYPGEFHDAGLAFAPCRRHRSRPPAVATKRPHPA